MRAFAEFVMRGRMQATLGVVGSAAFALLCWLSAAGAAWSCSPAYGGRNDTPTARLTVVRGNFVLLGREAATKAWVTEGRSR